ncbi:MAG: hypothetical protein ABIP41_05185 [Croceibacterium sp.]
MENGNQVYAIALLNKATFTMLRNSLNRVYRVDQTHRFDELIRQLDKIDAHG